MSLYKCKYLNVSEMKFQPKLNYHTILWYLETYTNWLHVKQNNESWNNYSASFLRVILMSILASKSINSEDSCKASLLP
jgi:hypothetical protein